eukprot:gb/GFBE01042900.1/.p1 GENE.gb/GFBE01042900.1/~~gb/GFBE01042900.1/.p1  ORF type:complete len:212 (+),score=45.19 gb/GFBE01042900.1/:1-636(+)
MPKVTVAFKYEEQEWSHEFDVEAAATVLDLKRLMTSSAPEHASWFELRANDIVARSAETIKPESSYVFRYLGPDGAEQPDTSALHAPSLPELAKSSSMPLVPDDDDEDPFPPAAAAKPSAAPAAPVATAPSASPAVTRWRIVGGADKGGIIVRNSESLKSPELGRVSTNAIVEEVARVGDRLCYRLDQGDGPVKGWVSIKVSGKELAVKCD